MKKVRTAHSYVSPPGYIPKGKPLTMPGMALTIRQVRDRFQRGQGVEVRNGVYNPEMPAGIEYMDRLDRIDAARAAAVEVQRQRAQLQQKAAAEKAAKQREAAQKAAAAAQQLPAPQQLPDSGNNP